MSRTNFIRETYKNSNDKSPEYVSEIKNCYD